MTLARMFLPSLPARSASLLVWLLASPLMVSACSDAPESSVQAARGDWRMKGAAGAAMDSPSEPAQAEEAAPPPSPKAARQERSDRAAPRKKMRPSAESVTDNEAAGGEEADDDVAAPMRSWFPETLLFAPSVVTDASGRASVPVRVPDRLTTWRVLALAHSRAGAQAGDVARFTGTLPTYVDVVVPPFVHAGDRLSVPVQIVNTTDAVVTQELVIEVEGASSSGLRRSLSTPAAASRTEIVDVVAGKPGTLTLRAKLGPEDAVTRTVDVRARGMPGSMDGGGTLAAPRTLALELPDDMEEGSGRVRLSVYPGALALLRSELAAAPSRTSPSDDAYLLLLSGRAAALAKQLGATVDEDEIKRLRFIATQRALRHARAPDPATAALFAEAALSHPGAAVLERLAERLTAQVASSQRPDGTFAGGSGWTLPHLLVATATSLRAIKASEGESRGRLRAVRATLLATGAFERHGGRVEDGYTAAAMVASGATSGELREKLIEIIVKALVQRPDGSRVLPVSDVAKRADGSRPSELEATALAALALEGHSKAEGLLPDLGASLVAGYRGGRGFGDGATNLLALTAVVRLFKEPVPASINIELLVDGELLVSGELSGEKLRDVAVLTAPLSAGGKRTFEIRATPPVPGLGFLVDVRYSAPWPKAPASPGLELLVERDEELFVGKPASITLTAAAPGGMPLTVRHALPAGMQAEATSLEKLVTEGVITRYRLEEGAVVLEASSRAQGTAFNARYRVVPTVAGTLYSGASSVAPLYAPHRPVFVPSPRWTVRR